MSSSRPRSLRSGVVVLERASFVQRLCHPLDHVLRALAPAEAVRIVTYHLTPGLFLIMAVLPEEREAEEGGEAIEHYRQARESLIVVNAHRINQGDFPVLPSQLGRGDFAFKRFLAGRVGRKLGVDHRVDQQRAARAPGF